MSMATPSMNTVFEIGNEIGYDSKSKRSYTNSKYMALSSWGAATAILVTIGTLAGVMIGAMHCNSDIVLKVCGSFSAAIVTPCFIAGIVSSVRLYRQKYVELNKKEVNDLLSQEKKYMQDDLLSYTEQMNKQIKELEEQATDWQRQINNLGSDQTNIRELYVGKKNEAERQVRELKQQQKQVQNRYEGAFSRIANLHSF